MRKFFISGTNTDVGKTYFSAAFSDYFINKNSKVKYIKPVQTGWPESDADFVLNNSSLEKKDVVTLYHHEKPVAPCLVFDKFPYRETVDYINSINDVDVLIVESAGGLLVPLDYEFFNYELALDCKLETIIVVPNKLGCINDSLLNYNFIKDKNINFTGFALNNYFMKSEYDSENKKIINKLTDNSVICEFDNKKFSYYED